MLASFVISDNLILIVFIGCLVNNTYKLAILIIESLSFNNINISLIVGKTFAPIKTKGRGGGKYIPCYTLAKRFKPYFDLWMKQRADLGIESEWLFPSKSNPAEQIGIPAWNSWANTFTRLSGKDFYAHSLRHYFTTCLARAGIPDGVIQSIIAWESSDMVRLYTDIDTDEQIGM